MDLDWTQGRWTHPPVDSRADGTALVVTAAEGSDAWRHTAYGFVHDSEHALVAPFAPDQAVEVDLVADFSEQFDQAGLFLRASDEHWVKAGVEFADGALQVGAVVTDRFSDWSVAPVEGWTGVPLTVRASWADGAVTIRAGRVGEPLRLVRVLPFAPPGTVEAGPLICAPTRSGFATTFLAWRVGEADSTLH